MIEITVPGKPIAKKRPRFSRRGKYVHTYSAQKKEQREYISQVSGQVEFEFCSIEGPLCVDMAFFMPRLKAHYGTGKNAAKIKDSAPKWHTKKPDIDNLEKWVLDCFNGLVWKDDSQIVKTTASKEYSEYPRTVIKIKGVDDEK